MRLTQHFGKPASHRQPLGDLRPDELVQLRLQQQARQQVALDLVALLCQQQRKLLRRLDPFGSDLEVELMIHRQDGAFTNR
jgi:hypothetical protein